MGAGEQDGFEAECRYPVGSVALVAHFDGNLGGQIGRVSTLGVQASGAMAGLAARVL
jgi:hypothetical protein